MDELEASTKEGLRLSGELPKKGSGSVAGLSGELPKKGSGKAAGSSGELPKPGSGREADEDGEGDRAVGERQEAEGCLNKHPMREAIAEQVKAWRRGTVSVSVETLELRNGNNYAKEGLDLTEGRGGQITWAGVVSRVKKAAEKGQLGMVLDAMDAIWDTEGPVPVLAEWLMEVWQ